ncbi:MAG: glycosyltransferase family 2 protein [Oscillospiraceae bacterium]|nr:glycosyltransferase family 2 protein [Oscillospiraceae bacterium]
MMEKATVLVLLATYNGENYIRPMVDSVLAQDYQDVKIILSDDNSTDTSPAILDEYAAMYPDRVFHYRSGMRFGCAQKHFMHLLAKFHDAPYIMFCDQDDVWHSDKIRKTLDKMKQVEAGETVPAMVHTDLRVVDRDLQELSASFWSHSDLDGSRLALNELLVQNVVTGCTMMINNPLAQLACRQIPQDAMLMHDWWLALLASACGRTGFLNEATIDYRQHGNNSVGAKNVRSVGYLCQRLRSKKMRMALSNAAAQAQVFGDCYRDLLTKEQTELIEAFASTQTAGLLRRDQIYIRHNLLKHGFVRVTAQLLGW